MLLILMLCVDPLMVHLADIGLIAITELIHTANQVIPLIRQVLQLLIQGHLVLPILNLFPTQVLQFGL